MAGSKRIKLDYICSARKQFFWIIEAKKGKCADPKSPPLIRPEEILQCHFYSLHPEINCFYFVVSNGWYTNLYDRDQLDETMEPLLSIPHSKIPECFLTLDSYIGSTQLLPKLKSDLIYRTEKILSAEIHEERLDEFIYEIQRAVGKLRGIVLSNWRNLRSQKKYKGDNPYELYLRNAPLEDIIKTILSTATSFGQLKQTSEIVFERFSIGDLRSNQFLFFSRLLLEEPFPVRHAYFYNTLYLLLYMYTRGIEKVNYYDKNKKFIEIVSDWTDLVVFSPRVKA